MATDQITQIICDYFGVSVEDIKGRDRSQSISVPRKLTCYVLKQLMPMSYEDLGTYMGLRDHSTVMYYVRNVRDKLPTTPMLQLHLQAIETLINEQHGNSEPAEQQVAADA